MKNLNYIFLLLIAVSCRALTIVNIKYDYGTTPPLDDFIVPSGDYILLKQ